ncbi:50S ribosomal protein L13 [bacterium HR29]|jgi:large subunit ribosomal protein L13|nr:50S ribosomal protein L13 [bacterium HR29]
MNTIRLKANEIWKDWHVVDAADRPLGRVASEVARLLRGKHKPTFEPHLDAGDFVVVINAAKIRLSGKKREEKVYYRHSGYPGGLKWRSFEEELAKHPERVIKRAVWGMLPKTSLGERLLKHLKVYPGPEHPHQAQLIGAERERQRRQAELLARVREDMAKKPPRLRPLRGLAVVAAATEAPAREEEAAPAVEAAPEGAAVAEIPEAAPPAEGAPRRRTRRTTAGAEPQAEASFEAPEPADEASPRRRTRARRTGGQSPSESEE